MKKYIVGLAACPGGIAHTYLVAEAIEQAAKNLGCEVKVETQGSIGIEDKLTTKDLERADLIVISVGVAVRDAQRLEGFEEKTIHVPIKKAIAEAETIISDCLIGGRQA